MRNKLSIQNFPCWIFTIGFISAMFFPRLVQKGLYCDGLTYASIARNLSVGAGSFWKPFFSSSMWLTYNSGPVFYEHLPLQFWIQSFFFRVMGDHWYVEKLYSFIALFIILWLITKIWKLVFHSHITASRAWLPLLFLFFLPEIIWAAPNNMLEFTMSVFILISVYFFIKALHYGNNIILYLLVSGFVVLLSFLTKGPVGLFPLAVPFIYYLVFRKFSFYKTVLYSLIPMAVFGISLFLILLIPEAKELLTSFFEQQMFSGIRGAREHAEQGLGRFSIFWYLLRGLSPLFGILIIILIFNFFKKIKFSVDDSHKKASLLFLLIGMAGSFPIMISQKQSAFYLVPSLFFYTMAFASFILPTINQYFTRFHLSKAKTKMVNYSLFLLLSIVAIYSISLAGRTGRDKQLQDDLAEVSKYVPEQSKLGVCPMMIGNAYLHAYPQRYYRIELTTNLDEVNYIMLDNSCKENLSDSLINNGFIHQTTTGALKFEVFSREE